MYKHDALNIIQFNDVPELGAYCLKENIYLSESESFGTEWTANLSAVKAAEICITGDMAQVNAASKMMDKFSLLIDSVTYMDMPSVAGAYPCVPEAISGEIESMRMPEQVSSDSAPLTVLVDVSCSSVVDAETMRKRGTAILAAVMALSAHRAVTLMLTCIMEGPRRPDANGDQFSIVTVNINTTPLDLATAAYALTNVGFARQLMYGVSKQKLDGMALGGNFGEFSGLPRIADISFDERPQGFSANSAEYRERICRYLNIDGEALIVPPAVNGNRTELLLKNPEAWVLAQMQLYGQRETA